MNHPTGNTTKSPKTLVELVQKLLTEQLKQIDRLEEHMQETQGLFTEQLRKQQSMQATHIKRVLDLSQQLQPHLESMVGSKKQPTNEGHVHWGKSKNKTPREKADNQPAARKE